MKDAIVITLMLVGAFAALCALIFIGQAFQHGYKMEMINTCVSAGETFSECEKVVSD